MAHWVSRLLRGAFFTVMLLGAGLITQASLIYFESGTLAPFVIEKLPVRFEGLFRMSLKVHVASAITSFPLCLVLMTRFLRRHRTWHRILGRITGVLVVGALVPSGVVLAFDAKGGLVVTLGFLLSALIVLLGMVYGVVYARRKDLLAHAWAMRHVVAQMSVAVTSRAMLVCLDRAGVTPSAAYVAALWIPVLASALIAERVSGRRMFPSLKFRTPLLRSLP